MVIGGGISGLLAAREFARAGVRTTVLEATDALGRLRRQPHRGRTDPGQRGGVLRHPHLRGSRPRRRARASPARSSHRTPAAPGSSCPTARGNCPRPASWASRPTPGTRKSAVPLACLAPSAPPLDAVLPASLGTAAEATSVAALVRATDGQARAGPARGPGGRRRPLRRSRSAGRRHGGPRTARRHPRARLPRRRRRGPAPAERRLGRPPGADRPAGAPEGRLRRRRPAWRDAHPRDRPAGPTCAARASRCCGGTRARSVQRTRGRLASHYRTGHTTTPACWRLRSKGRPPSGCWKAPCRTRRPPPGQPDPTSAWSPSWWTSRRWTRRPRGTGVLVAPQSPGVQAKALTHGTAKWAWLASGRARAGTFSGSPTAAQKARRRTGVPRRRGRRVPALRRGTVPRSAAPTPRPCSRSRHRRGRGRLGRGPLGRGAALCLPGHKQRVAAVRSACAADGTLAVVGGWLSGNGLAAIVADTAPQVRRSWPERCRAGFLDAGVAGPGVRAGLPTWPLPTRALPISAVPTGSHPRPSQEPHRPQRPTRSLRSRQHRPPARVSGRFFLPLDSG